MRLPRLKSWWIFSALLLLMLVIIVGCQGTTTPDETSPDPAEDDRRGGILEIGVHVSPLSFDGFKTNWPTYYATDYLFDRLVGYDDEENLIPELVEDWDISDDGLVYTLNLRDDVVFHDDTPFNAEAVAFNFEYHSDPESRHINLYQAIDDVEIVDEYKIVVTLKEPSADWLISWPGVISPTAGRELGPENFHEAPVGTGPFKFSKYEADSYIDYVRHDDYWRGAPLLDGLRVRILPETSVHTLELIDGSLDISYQVAMDDYDRLQAEGITLEKAVSPNVEFISLNVSKGHMREWAVRRAIALAVDREYLLESMMMGFGELSRAGVRPVSPLYHDDIPEIPHDPEEAGRILDEAGWEMGNDGVRHKDGEALVLDILSNSSNQRWHEMDQIIQSQLRDVGMDSVIRGIEEGTYLDMWRDEGDYELTFHGQGWLLHSQAAVNVVWAPDEYWQVTHVKSSDDPELMEVADRLRTLYEEFDTTASIDERAEIAHEVQTIFYEQQLAVFLWHPFPATAVRPEVKDYSMYKHGRQYDLHKAWLDQ